METRVTQDIAERFSLDQVSHHELLEIFRLRYMTCWRVSKNQITFPASHDYRLKVNVSHGLIEQIFAGKSLSDGELDELLAQVSADSLNRLPLKRRTYIIKHQSVYRNRKRQPRLAAHH